MVGTAEIRHFFSDEERERIREAVVAVERVTSGEIAVMPVEQSEAYREAEVLGGVFLSGLISLAVCVALHHITVWTYIPVTVLLFIPCRLLFQRFPRLKLPFAGRKRIGEAVRDAAVRAFYEKGLHRTRNETGILVYLSLLEHRVWILADRGINEKIDPGHWKKLADILAAGVKEGRGCDAVCGVIAECGYQLATHFPRTDDDVNELSDEVIA